MDEEVIPLERCAPPELKVGLHQLTQMPPGTQSQVTPAHTIFPRNSKSGYTSSHKCPPELKVRLHQLAQMSPGTQSQVTPARTKQPGRHAECESRVPTQGGAEAPAAGRAFGAAGRHHQPPDRSVVGRAGRRLGRADAPCPAQSVEAEPSAGVERAREGVRRGGTLLVTE